MLSPFCVQAALEVFAGLRVAAALAGFLCFGLQLFPEGLSLGAGFGPLAVERFEQNWAEDRFDVCAAGEVGADLGALAGVEGAFEQGAEDGGLDAGPVAEG